MGDELTGPEKHYAEYQREYKRHEKRTLNRRRASHLTPARPLLAKYRLTKAQYHAMRHAQGNHCALCPRDGKLVIDHDHDTGLVRALLCNRCNVAVGGLETINGLSESIHVTAAKLADYVQKYKPVSK